MGRSSPPQGVPIMRVNPQPHHPNQATQNHLRLNLAPRKFLVKTFEPPSLERQPADQITTSKLPQTDSGSTTPLSLEFVDTTFPNGVAVQAKSSPGERPPPRKRRRTTKPGPREHRPLRLSARNPVQNASDVHKDIWRQVLNFCDPKLLLEAKTIDRTRYEILSHHQAIWRNSRLRHFPDCPPCPTRLTEQQYADLLVGRGCQIPTCSQRNVSSVSWAFLGRLCVECLRHRIVKAEDLPRERQHRLSPSKELWEALPMILYTSHRHGPPRPLNTDGTDWAWPRGSFLFLKSDYDKLEAEYLDLKSADTTETAILQWWSTKKNETMRHMRETNEIWEWRSRTRYEQEGSNSRDRRRFFQEKAATMDPPMSAEVLDCMSAFHKALRSSNPPTDLAWEILKEKIVRHREVAVRLSEIRAQHHVYGWDYDRLNPLSGKALEHKLLRHRAARYDLIQVLQPEQSFAIELGRKEFAKCVEGGISDSNLVLTCLKNVFEAYQTIDEPPDGLNFDGSTGPYKLSMDDAQMIIQEVMEPEIAGSSARGTEVFFSFKCPGCRTDHQPKRSWSQSMNHVYERHSQVVGDDEQFWRLHQSYELPFPRSFPWYTTPWMRCIPVLPSYCDARTTPPWHPDSEMGFLQEQDVPTASAFEGRAAIWAGDGPPEFIEAFTHAVTSMQGVALTAQCKVKVALKYALDLRARFKTEVPPLDEFVTGVASIQKGKSPLGLRVRCEACFRGEQYTPRARPVKYEVSVEHLHKHWRSRHAGEGLDWTQEFMRLPSDADVLEEMRKSDEQTEKEKERVWAFAQTDDVKKRPHPKAAVVLGMRLAKDVFAELYPSVD